MTVFLDCPCGERLVAADADALVAVAQRHLADAHPGRTYSREEILTLAGLPTGGRS